jgi:hypothetical protein
MDPNVVAKGFYIISTIEEIRAHLDKLVAAGRMNLETGKHLANSAERGGICDEPLLYGYLNPHLHVYPVHCKINGLHWWENLIVLYNCRHYWPDDQFNRKDGVRYYRKTKEQNEAMVEKKNDMRNRARKKDGLNAPLAMPDANGHGVSVLIKMPHYYYRSDRVRF